MNTESFRFGFGLLLACFGLALSIAAQVSPSWARARYDYAQGVISVSNIFNQGLWLVSLYSSLTFGQVAADDNYEIRQWADYEWMAPSPRANRSECFRV